MAKESSVKLSVIDTDSMARAVREFDRLGRKDFLGKYGFSRSMDFYFLYNGKIYDTKPLVAAAYKYKTRKKLKSGDFQGGLQTKAVFARIMKHEPFRGKSVWFRDTLNELRNLPLEYARFPHNASDLRKLGFSDWIPYSQFHSRHRNPKKEKLHKSRKRDHVRLPGIYVIAKSGSRPKKTIDKKVIYIGETVEQTLNKRLDQFHKSMFGKKAGHSGGSRSAKKKIPKKNLWISVRNFPLSHNLDEKSSKRLRSAQIRYLERRLLCEYVQASREHKFPVGNSK